MAMSDKPPITFGGKVYPDANGDSVFCVAVKGTRRGQEFTADMAYQHKDGRVTFVNLKFGNEAAIECATTDKPTLPQASHGFGVQV